MWAVKEFRTRRKCKVFYSFSKGAEGLGVEMPQPWGVGAVSFYQVVGVVGEQDAPVGLV